MNDACQKHVSEWLIGRIGAVDGITVGEKVIQVRNRPRSDMVWAYDRNTRAALQVEVFNGEIGVVRLHPYDNRPSASAGRPASANAFCAGPNHGSG